MDQDRRKFLKTCGCLSAVGALTFIGIGCDKNDGGGGSTGPVEPAEITIDLDDYPALQNDNSATSLTGTPGGTLLLTHTTGETYFALSNICTHQGCGVAATTPTLNCPCHGSRYALNGSVVQGPAPQSLTSFPVTKQGNLLTISFG
jgi:Rieske Fe-S protein